MDKTYIIIIFIFISAILLTIHFDYNRFENRRKSFEDTIKNNNILIRKYDDSVFYLKKSVDSLYLKLNSLNEKKEVINKKIINLNESKKNNNIDTISSINQNRIFMSNYFKTR